MSPEGSNHDRNERERMTTELQGICVRVITRPYEVRAFAQKWPGSNLPDDAGFDFVFDARNGDCVDIQVRNEAGRICAAAAEFDGPALLALSNDAQAAAMRASKEARPFVAHAEGRASK